MDWKTICHRQKKNKRMKRDVSGSVLYFFLAIWLNCVGGTLGDYFQHEPRRIIRIGFVIGGWTCVGESSELFLEKKQIGEGWQIKIKFVNTDLYTVYNTIIDDASVATLLSLRIWHSMLLAIFSFPRKWLCLNMLLLVAMDTASESPSLLSSYM